MEKVGIGSEFLYPFFFLSRYLVRSEYFSVIVVVLRILREKKQEWGTWSKRLLGRVTRSRNRFQTLLALDSDVSSLLLTWNGQFSLSYFLMIHHSNAIPRGQTIKQILIINIPSDINYSYKDGR
jgi:hypothetical protein